MDKYLAVNQTMVDSVMSSNGKIINDWVSVDGLSFIKLRDILYRIGKIVSEDAEKKIYTANLKSGFLKMASVILVIQLQDNDLLMAAYSYGAINRKKVCKGAINELKSRVGEFTKKE